jgi:hypothetical protein
VSLDDDVSGFCVDGHDRACAGLDVSRDAEDDCDSAPNPTVRRLGEGCCVHDKRDLSRFADTTQQKISMQTQAIPKHVVREDKSTSNILI